jgi:hypothetical protein
VLSKSDRIKDLMQAGASTSNPKKSSADWTDELRESLRYLVSALLASIPLYQRCPPPHEWKESGGPEENKPRELPAINDVMDLDQADAEEEDAGDDEEDDDSSTDAVSGRAHKYADGFVSRPLNTEQTELLVKLYKGIGGVLQKVALYLKEHRPDDMQAFIELSTVYLNLVLLTADYILLVASPRHGGYERHSPGFNKFR